MKTIHNTCNRVIPAVTDNFDFFETHCMCLRRRVKCLLLFIDVKMDHKHLMHKFYAAANTVCGHVKFASHMSVLFLLETLCLPLLSYCCEVLVYSKQQISQLNVCWSNAYRKTFKYNFWSVKELQLFCERVDLKHVFAFS